MNPIIEQLDIIDFTSDCKIENIDLFNDDKFGLVKVYQNEDQPVLFLKEVDSFNLENLKLISKIQHISWNYQKVLFLYVYSKTEIRIYNCSEKPIFFNKDSRLSTYKTELKKLEVFTCRESDKQKLETLNVIFSRIAIDTGFVWSSVEAEKIRKKIKLQNRVDEFLIKSLVNVSSSLESKGLNNKDIIHKLVMRSLFLLYLEDRKATSPEFYQSFQTGAISYFEVLESVSATYRLFDKLANDFNGGLFIVAENEKDIVTKEHLTLIKKCFTNGFVDEFQMDLFEDWRLFDFSIIQIELLSEIYETFLSKLDEKEKKKTGTYYTPPTLVELILNETLPVKNKTNYNVKILDPSCGSGIFLVQSFKRLVKRYEKKHNKKLTDFKILREILQNNIFGIELDSKSVKVAAFSLYLALLDNLNPKTGWWNGKIKFPYLINNPEDDTLKQQGNNLFVKDTISDLSNINELQNFDLIVGNPPFGTKDLLPTIREYCNRFGFAKEMVLPFLHKATTLSPTGKIALIFNTKVLTNTGSTYHNFREWLFNETYVEKVYNFSILRKAKKNFGGQLFKSAVGPISIVFYKNEIPKRKSETILYYAPKTYIKNNIIEGVVIDSNDVKNLPRTECEKPDTKIWKISMWGSFFDFKLIKQIENDYSSLEQYFQKHKDVWLKGCGLHKASKKNIEKRNFILPPNKVHQSKKIERYFTPKTNLVDSDKKCANMNTLLFSQPFLMIKEGQKNNQFCSSFIDFDSCYYNTVFGIKTENVNDLKILCSLFNSKFSNYYLSLITSSWGIERERVLPTEMLQLPYVFEDGNFENIVKNFNLILSIKKANSVEKNITHIEKIIDDIILNDILKLSSQNQIILNDTIKYSLDLFEKQEKSNAVKTVVQIESYVNMLSDELNDWLEDVDLKVSSTIFDINKNSPLYIFKISFGTKSSSVNYSNENLNNLLKNIDESLWAKEGEGLYFRKKLNYYDGDDVFIIKPNQRRFWSQTSAMEDARELLIEIGNGNG